MAIYDYTVTLIQNPAGTIDATSSQTGNQTLNFNDWVRYELFGQSSITDKQFTGVFLATPNNETVIVWTAVANGAYPTWTGGGSSPTRTWPGGTALVTCTLVASNVLRLADSNSSGSSQTFSVHIFGTGTIGSTTSTWIADPELICQSGGGADPRRPAPEG